jgi:hypothetical protein
MNLLRVSRERLERLWPHKTLSQISDETGETEAAVYAAAVAYGLELKGPPPPEDDPGTCPSPETIRIRAAAIRKRWTPGERSRRLVTQRRRVCVRELLYSDAAFSEGPSGKFV